MANFAKIGLNNVVISVVFIDNIDNMTKEGVEDEQVGNEYLSKLYGHVTWVQTSYNGNFRGKYAAVGDTYDPQNDEFVSTDPLNPVWPDEPI